MGETPQETNQPAKLVDDVLRVAFQIALPIALAAEIAAVPALGVWPVSWIFNKAQTFIAEKIRLALAMGSTFLIIDFQTAEERKKFAEAVKILLDAIKKGNLNDPELIKRAKELDDAFNRLVRFDGSYHPH